jgi:hypothetical protein
LKLPELFYDFNSPPDHAGVYWASTIYGADAKPRDKTDFWFGDRVRLGATRDGLIKEGVVVALRPNLIGVRLVAPTQPH